VQCGHFVHESGQAEDARALEGFPNSYAPGDLEGFICRHLMRHSADYAWAKLIRRACVPRFIDTECVGLEDRLFTRMLYPRLRRAAYLKAPLCSYRIREGSLLRNGKPNFTQAQAMAQYRILRGCVGYPKRAARAECFFALLLGIDPPLRQPDSRTRLFCLRMAFGPEISRCCKTWGMSPKAARNWCLAAIMIALKLKGWEKYK